MPIEVLACCDSQFDVLTKILLTLPSIAGGSGDVVGPASSVNNDIVLFDGATGKLIKDSGIPISSVNTTLQSGSQAIANNVDTVSVVFPIAYAAIPDIVLTISRPAAEPLIDANIDEASITVAGFTVSLGATTGSANYNLKWMAN